ncbi:hypothetical protein TNCV_844371 [Trichonephila clavipes]|uniref:Transposase n=1 Tax=Trichonephila clavipes TaxID=2585209 RepID=A0A8X6WHQ9_TRICX|nr:hypothetical protein TNCV_844371 [Trichonephila clavipes]
MYYSIDMNFFYSKDNLVALHFKYDQARRRFVEWAQNEIAVVPDFHKRIFLSDEAHFWLNGYVNKQNCRIWSEANPQVYVETPLHPQKLTVCALYGLVESSPSYYHERYQRYYGLFADTTNASCSLRKAQVHGISALHSSMFNVALSPSPKNSYMELYQMSTQAMARKKDEMVSELKTLPHVLEMIATNIKSPLP